MPNFLKELFHLIKSDSALAQIKLPLLNLIETTPNLNSKAHPLGFYSISLGNINDTCAVRLHLWTKDAKIQNEHLLIHNHIFNLKSFVICGSLTNKTYNISKANDNSEGTLYSVKYTENGSSLTRVDSGYIIEQSSKTKITAGEYYCVDSSEFHETINSENSFAATILITERVKEIAPIVYGKYNMGEFLEFDRVFISELEINHALDQLLIYLKA